MTKRLGLWHKKLKDIIAEAERRGFKIEYKTDTYFRDYAGMNPEAAKDLGWQCPKNVIRIDRSLSEEDKYHTIKHELEEYDKMHNRNWDYRKAHFYALDNE